MSELKVYRWASFLLPGFVATVLIALFVLRKEQLWWGYKQLEQPANLAVSGSAYVILSYLLAHSPGAYLMQWERDTFHHS